MPILKISKTLKLIANHPKQAIAYDTPPRQPASARVRRPTLLQMLSYADNKAFPPAAN